MHYSGQYLTSSMSRPIITSLHLMPTLLPMWLVMLWAFFAARPRCCLMSSLLSTSTPKSSSAELLPHHSDPCEYSCRGFFPCEVRHLAFVLAEFHNVPAGPPLQSVQVVLDKSPAFGCNHQPSLFGVTCKLEDQALHCLLQMFNGTAPMTDPCGVVPRVQYNPFTTLPGAPSTGLVSFWWWAASPSSVVSQMAEEREEVASPAPLAPTLLTEGSAGRCLCHKATGAEAGVPRHWASWLPPCALSCVGS